MKSTVGQPSFNRATHLVAPGCALVLLLILVEPGAAHDPTTNQIDAVSKTIEKETDDARYYLHRAELNRVDRRFLEAEQDLFLAQEAGADPAHLQLCRASLHRDRGDLAQGLRSVNTAIELAPELPQSFRLRAELLERLGKPLAAVSDLIHLIELEDRPRPELYIRRSRILEELGSGHVHDAYDGILQGIDRLGPVPTLELRAVQLEVALSRYDSALSRLEILENRFDNPVSLLVQRADVLRLAGREIAAITVYTDALTLIESSATKRTPGRNELEMRIRTALQMESDLDKETRE